MKRRFHAVTSLLVILVTFFSGCAANRKMINERFRDLEGKEHLTVIMLGNAFYEPRWEAGTASFMRGYMKSLLGEVTNSDVSVLNASLPEDTFADIMRRVDMDIISYRPDIVFMMVGLFDSNRRGLSETTFREQVKELFSVFNKYGVFVVVLTSIGYRDAYYIADERILRLKEFNEMIVWEAGLHQLPVIDVFGYVERLRQTDHAEYQTLFKDQILLNDKGYDYVLSYVKNNITKAYRQRD